MTTFVFGASGSEAVVSPTSGIALKFGSGASSGCQGFKLLRDPCADISRTRLLLIAETPECGRPAAHRQHCGDRPLGRERQLSRQKGEPKTGFEPVTYRLRIDCTTTVLLRRKGRQRNSNSGNFSMSFFRTACLSAEKKSGALTLPRRPGPFFRRPGWRFSPVPPGR